MANGEENLILFISKETNEWLEFLSVMSGRSKEEVAIALLQADVDKEKEKDGKRQS